MTVTKLPRWIACIFICTCLCLLSACSGPSEQELAYKKAESETKSPAGYIRYKDAAILFEKAGNFKDAAEKSKEYWYRYALFRKRFEVKTLQERLEALQEAKSAFAHLGEYKDSVKQAAETEAALATAQVWVAVQAAQDNGDDNKAIALLEALEPKDKKARDTLTFLKTKEQRAQQMALFREYLERVPQPGFTLDEKQPLHTNLDKLFAMPALKNKWDVVADALASMRCYDLIAKGWNNQLYITNQRKLKYQGPALQTPLTASTLLLATIQLAEAGDETPEFAEVLALLRGIVISPQSARHNEDVQRYAKLLELYDAGPEWARKVFPDNEELKSCDTPGSVAYRVVRAPQRIKKILYDESTDLQNNRFTREYSAAEAKALFTNFVPAKPLKAGFIVVTDQGTPPKNAGGSFGGCLSYQSPTNFITASYEPLLARPSPKARNPATHISTTQLSSSGMIEERIMQKGEFFCVANPNNARLAIYETYSYKHYGAYRVEGKQDLVNVYLPTVNIRVVDLVTKKTLLTDTIGTNAQQRYTVPTNIKQGDAYVPSLFFDRYDYLKKKLPSARK